MSKTKLTDLAILGGPAAFSEKLCVGTPNIGNREDFRRRMDDLLDRRWLTNNGVYVQEFEAGIAKLCDVPHCISVCNATIGLQMAIRALDLKGEVILPSFTFVASAHSLAWEGVTPVFCDADPITHNLDPNKVEDLITPRTTGIMGVHLWGRACAVDELTDIADRHHLKLLFDGAHAIGSSHKGQMLGSFGDCEVLSFHATKALTSFEGGAILTCDDRLAERLRKMRNFGFAGVDHVVDLGTNGKMCEASAAMGLTSLESFANTVSVNQSNYEAYGRELAGLPGVKLVPYDRREKNPHQYVILEIDDTCPLTRDDLVRVLTAENVLARRYFTPGCHRMEPYCSQDPHAGERLPVTEKLAKSLMALPTGTALPAGAIDAIGGLMRLTLQRGSILKPLLNQVVCSESMAPRKVHVA